MSALDKIKRWLLEPDTTFQPAPFIAAGTAKVSGTKELYTDGIIEKNKSYTVYFYRCDEMNTGNCEWHYYGVLEKDKKKKSNDPHAEYSSIVIPDDLAYLPLQIRENILYELAKQIANHKYGMV